MNCEDFDFVAYEDGQLDREEAASVKDHLLRCDACREKLEQFSALVRAGIEATAMSLCPSADEITGLALGKIESKDAARLREHIEGCAPCAEGLAVAKRSLEAMEDVDIEPESASFPDRLAAFINEKSKELSDKLQGLIGALEVSDESRIKQSLERLGAPLQRLCQVMELDPIPGFPLTSDRSVAGQGHVDLLLPTISQLSFSVEDMVLEMYGKDDGTMEVRIQKAAGGPMDVEIQLENAVGQIQEARGDPSGRATLKGVPFGNNSLIIRAIPKGSKGDE